MKDANTCNKNNSVELVNEDSLVRELIRKRRSMLSAYESVSHVKRKLDDKVHSIKMAHEEEIFEIWASKKELRDERPFNEYSLGYIEEITDTIGECLNDFVQYAWQTLFLAYQCLKAIKYDVPIHITESVFRDNDYYLYVQVVNECFKRRAYIPVEINLSGLYNEGDTFNIKSFQFCNVRYEERGAFKTATEIKNYVMNITGGLLGALSELSLCRKK